MDKVCNTHFIHGTMFTYTMYNRLKNLVNYVLHIMVFFVHLITLDIDYVSKIRCTTYVLCTARPGDVIQFLHTNTTIYILVHVIKVFNLLASVLMSEY